MSKICVHATTIALNGSAVLIRGASGSGKSSLALQVLETVGTGLTGGVLTATLVSDDQTELTLRGDKIFASPAAALAGMIEVRGQGIVRVPFVRDAPLALVVEFKSAAEIERMPSPEHLSTELMGIRLPLISIDPNTASAASRLRLAWAQMVK